jgi:hypothetical protein
MRMIGLSHSASGCEPPPGRSGLRGIGDGAIRRPLPHGPAD